MVYYLSIIALWYSLVLQSCETDTLSHGSVFQDKNIISIPAAGNSWVTSDLWQNDRIISDNGISGWNDKALVIKTWFRTELAGPIEIAVRAKVISGKSTIKVIAFGEEKTISLSNTSYDTLKIGSFRAATSGYQVIELQGVSKTGETFAEISSFLVSGPAASGKIYFVRDDFYFGRRGPSVHLRYDLANVPGNIEWFYNEITVPQGNDVIGSYYMANGFADGYFGIQVNSPSERRILFSVWSPYKTDNPGEIPDEYKIILLKKGSDVITKEFGNEGSGGQSYRIFPWKAGSTYRFLLNGHPADNNSTDYTAWFYAPENGKWELIASFRRPKTNNYLKNLYSFLENFMPETGPLERMGHFSNQWARTEDGIWHELTSARFTADATARKESRLDYSGGVENGRFYLRNCGFFSDFTKMDQSFTRQGAAKIPAIEIQGLE